MTSIVRRLIAALLFVGIAPNCIAADNAYALTNANLFNGVDDRIYADVSVLVRGGKIERIVAASTKIPASYTIIDLAGNYLMPGMFDVHTHISSLDQAQRALESGVTTIRSASVTAYQDVALQDQ